MNILMDKPYSFSLSVCILVLGLLVCINTEFLLSGSLLILSAFVVYMSLPKSEVKKFKVGQYLTYLSGLIFYYQIAEVLNMALIILIGMSTVMFHITLNQIINAEFE